MVASQDQFHFDLYLRNREMEQVYAALDEIRSRSPEEKKEFMLEQRDFLDDLAGEIWDQVRVDLQDVSLDPESLQLIAQYTGQVRDTFNLLRELKSTTTLTAPNSAPNQTGFSN